MKLFLLTLFTGIGSVLLFGQDRPQNGVAPSFPDAYILKNATIIVSPQKTISNGYILIEKGKVKDIGNILLKPANAVEIDCKGKTIVPAFIDLDTDLGMQKPPSAERRDRTPQIDSKKEQFFSWNDAVRPEFLSAENYKTNETDNEKLAKAGFGFALTHLNDGIVRGTGSVIALGSHPVLSSLFAANVSTHFSLEKGSSRQTYPSSQMGSIALLRQTLYDVKWYQKHADNATVNLSLEALAKQLEKPIFFSTSEALEILRGDKIAHEFHLKFNFYGSGNEYQHIDAIKKTGATIIIPAHFPDAYNVSDPYINMEIPLKELKHWELAPSNPYLLASNGIPICFTFGKNKSEKEFWTNIRKAMERGLSFEQALTALTITPAKTIGLEKETGTLEIGKIASFSVYSENPFEKEADLLETWTFGQPKLYKEAAIDGLDGNYRILVENKTYNVDITKKGNGYEGKQTNAVKKEYEKVAVSVSSNDITIQLKDSINGIIGTILLHGKINSKVGVFEGEGTDVSGKWVKWNAIKHKKIDADKKNKTLVTDSLYKNKIWFPNMAYGYDSLPKQQSYIIKNVTAWTNEAEGIVKNATVVVENGKIHYVGTGNFKKPVNAVEIDGTGMHLTTGIIDEHSHIAISRGVNEGGQSVSAEVSIGDVVRNNDINIYRQLAGGVTTSQLLHGSANAIGGQSAIIKLKWGYTPDEMLVPNAPKFIKFALGENVKQSNWGEEQTIRFPQTRMGVEQVYVDAFSRAQKYMEEKSKGKKDSHRVDLELEALAEILNKERFITCHSYIQSEINMLMKVADTFGFHVNTFTHILEGYKVADKMLKHGAGASTFADWWAYKFEVLDAIPYNASLIHEQGVVVAINSDDAEMGRRLNQEAAKAMKYGGMKEEDAWKMVTLNPAKLLHLDDRLGSMKVGKDADLVLWTDNPLTITAIPETVFIDGILFFDRKQDLERQARNQKEKARIISKMLESNNSGGEKKTFQPTEPKFFHCDTFGEEGSSEHNGH
ncbi:MAG: amidohydrolase family protein [Crocinitomicaceae bacterium]|nr:amidohydrolase family protein [Crocinitomicaceae bacterium]